MIKEKLRCDTSKINEAINIIGSGIKLARILEVSEANVYKWKNGSAAPGIVNCLRIQKATGGKIKARDILPDYDWDNILPAE